MIRRQIVRKYDYYGRSISFHCVIDDKGVPIFAPTMFLFDSAIEGSKQTTTRSYASDLGQFFSILENTYGADGGLGQDYREVTEAQMSAYLHSYLKQQKKLKDKSIKRHIASIQGFYDFCYKKGFMKNKADFSYSFGDDDIKVSFIEGMNINLHKQYMNELTFKNDILGNLATTNPFIHERDALALKLGYYAGFRTHELTIADNLSTNKLRQILPYKKNWTPETVELKVRGKGSGNSGKLRSIMIDVDLTKSIYDFLWGKAKHIKTTLMSTPNGTPLKNPSHGSSLFRECVNNFLSKKHLKTLSAQQFNLWQDRGYHDLRKCFATNSVSLCYKLNIDPRVFVTQWMGHSDPKTTDLYIFYDAVLNDRPKIISELSLEKTQFATSYTTSRKTINKKNNT